MPKNGLITVYCFDAEIGRLGYDSDRQHSIFQYSPAFLESGNYKNLFPYLIKRTAAPQIFRKKADDHFNGLPPAIADSLPDVFGNLVFKAWLDANNKNMQDISVLEQLAYVGKRGMGALAYRPAVQVAKKITIDIEEIVEVLRKVMDIKKGAKAEDLDTQSLLNIFKIGTSAGGARPKILISQHNETGKIIPGDLEISADYNHYLIKLSMDEAMGYNREMVEFSYYQLATSLGIEMMPSKMVDGKHFATLRFDRIDGEKKHVLTASGITGIDFSLNPKNSSYENLFDLALYLKISGTQLEELFKRMVFNVVFCNYDDHMKNHAFSYDPASDRWKLSPAYDLTYAINPKLKVTRYARALSINGKRDHILLEDLLYIAEKYTIRNPKGIISEVVKATEEWPVLAVKLGIPNKIVDLIDKDFKRF